MISGRDVNMENKKIIDISVLIQEDADNYVKETPLIPIGSDTFIGFRADMNVHYGTHLDAPCHKSPNPKTIDQYPLERFLVPAVVIESMDPVSVKLADVQGKEITPGCAVLLKTENSRSERSRVLPYEGAHVFVEPDALKYIIDQGASMVGFDSPHGEEDAEDMAHQKNPIHTLMFDNDCIILESVDLKDVEPGTYTLAAFPVKFAGVSASPARAVLIREK